MSIHWWKHEARSRVDHVTESLNSESSYNKSSVSTSFRESYLFHSLNLEACSSLIEWDRIDTVERWTDRFVRLRVNRSFISEREWWSNQISNVLFKNVVFSWVQLWDLWQEIVSNYSLFQTMTSWIEVSENIYQCANWSQKLEIFHDHEEIKQTLSEMSRIFCWIRL